MAELSAYQKKKQVADLMKTLDKGQKGQLLEALLGEWAEAIPKRAKDYGVVGGTKKFVERLQWLQEHWGTAFKTKGSTALRKMPLSGVLELLTLFTLKAAETKDEFVSFGSLEDGSRLSERVASGLSALQVANGPQVVISRSAYDQLQAIRREFEEGGGEGPEASTKILRRIFDQLQSMPAVKSEKENTRYESAVKKEVDAKSKAFSK